MRSWPAALATALGAVSVLAGIGIFAANSAVTAASARAFSLVTPLLLGGAVLLAAGLHALQASLAAWCDCADCQDGCGCCGDGCACGDCAACGDGKAAGPPSAAAEHSH